MAPIGKPKRRVRRPIPKVNPNTVPEAEPEKIVAPPIFVPRIDAPAIPVPNWPTTVPVETPQQ